MQRRGRADLAAVAVENARYVAEVAGTGARVLDTRKTIPGLRVLEKYATRMGGARNHRMRLDDATRAEIRDLVDDFVVVDITFQQDGKVVGKAEEESLRVRPVLSFHDARLEGFDNHLQVWPAHGAGSSCGKAIGAVPTSTIGYERLHNAALSEQVSKCAFDLRLAAMPGTGGSDGLDRQAVATRMALTQRALVDRLAELDRRDR